jgi:3-oxoacyl-[acyl-carrier-protein] synthase II
MMATANKRRVVITGMGTVSTLGLNASEMWNNLLANKTGIKSLETLPKLLKLQTPVGAYIPDFDGSSIPRTERRSMSKVSQMATLATSEAIRQSDLPQELIQNKRTGIAYGSLMGGLSTVEAYLSAAVENGSYSHGIQSTSFLQMMSHTAAANLAMAFKVPGRLVATSVACSAGSQSIGLAYEMIQNGHVDRMIAGGADEMHPSIIACFEVLRATSQNMNPDLACRPFSSVRDGMVCGEGAATFILEDFDTAQKRGARILAEIIGFASTTDTSHMTNPSSESMASVMEEALETANIRPSAISYVCAHAPATSVGDAAECLALHKVFGEQTPVASLKGHFGHTMGASGAVELVACLKMIEHGQLIATRSLEAPIGPKLNLNWPNGSTWKLGPIVKNTFAFGGVNVSLVLTPFR